MSKKEEGPPATPTAIDAAVARYMKSQGVAGHAAMRYVETLFRQRIDKLIRDLSADAEAAIKAHVRARIAALTEAEVAVVVREKLADRITVQVLYKGAKADERGLDEG